MGGTFRGCVFHRKLSYLKYRATLWGKCKSLPALKTCIQAFDKGDLKFERVFNGFYNSTQCVNNTRNTTICKPKAMTQKKNEKYSTLKCPGNSLLAMHED